MQERINVQLFGYQIGFYIQEENKPNKNRDYELSSLSSTLLKCSDEDMGLWVNEVKQFIYIVTSRLILLKEDYLKAKGLEFNIVSINSFVNDCYVNAYKGIQMHIPHLVLYYLKYDSVKVIELLTLLDDLFMMLPKTDNELIMTSGGGHICGITRDILELRNEVNNFNNTLKRITDNNYFFKIENLDVSKIVNIYLRQPNDLKYTVWVGGTEVVDHYVSLEEANRIANEYKEKGYDDVQVEIKE